MEIVSNYDEQEHELDLQEMLLASRFGENS